MPDVDVVGIDKGRLAQVIGKKWHQAVNIQDMMNMILK